MIGSVCAHFKLFQSLEFMNVREIQPHNFFERILHKIEVMN